MDRERDRFVGFVAETVEWFDPSHRLKGSTWLEDPHTLGLDTGEAVRANRIVIATGSVPVRPDMFAKLFRQTKPALKGRFRHGQSI